MRGEVQVLPKERPAGVLYRFREAGLRLADIVQGDVSSTFVKVEAIFVHHRLKPEIDEVRE